MSAIRPFAVQHDIGGRGRVIALSAELDMAAAPQLDAVLAELPGDGATALTVDLSGSTFMDSTGLHASPGPSSA